MSVYAIKSKVFDIKWYNAKERREMDILHSERARYHLEKCITATINVAEAVQRDDVSERDKFIMLWDLCFRSLNILEEFRLP